MTAFISSFGLISSEVENQSVCSGSCEEADRSDQFHRARLRVFVGLHRGGNTRLTAPMQDLVLELRSENQT